MELISLKPGVKTNFVFSGGGIRGYWQWELFDQMAPLFDIDFVCGSSTGALTALLASKQVPKAYVQKLYTTACSTNASNIFKPGLGRIKDGKFKINEWQFVPKLIFNRSSIKGFMSPAPLIETVKQIQKDFPAFKYRYAMNIVDLHTSARIALSYEDFYTDDEFARGVAASCAIPGLVEPIYDLVTKKGMFGCCVDGGTREGLPLQHAFQAMDADKEYQVVVLGCNTRETTPVDQLGSIFNILGATATAVLNEMQLDDEDKVELINELIKEKGEQVMGKRFVPIFKIYYKGGRGVLDFTLTAMESMAVTAREDNQRFRALLAA